MAMSEWLQREWTRTSGWQLLLRPVSWLFRLLSALRRAAYRLGLLKTQRLPVPVIVVGNISVGGTGKTPLVIWLAQQLQAAGLNPGIISRGYRGKHGLPISVTGYSNPAEVGDEPVMLAERTQLPVFVARDRVAAGMALLQAHPQCGVLISDDGLQHYRLGRDVEIAVVDGARRFGNGQLLPAGPLREPEARLDRVDAVVGNGEAAEEGMILMQLRPGVFRNLLDPGKTATAADFAGKKLLAIAGIGHPPRFFAQLENMGLEIETRAFPDHHAYTPDDLPSGSVDAILMTEKDAVKCRAFARPEWWYLEVEAQLDHALLERVLNKLRK
jgi:tetraacyldisaccharide 4'-kinase